MTTAALLAEAQAAGVTVRAEQGALHLSARRPPPSLLVERLRSHKAELMALLGSRAEEAASPVAHDLDAEAVETLSDWLRDEGLCLVLRDGVLIFTEHDGRGAGAPSAALRQHVEAHRPAIAELLAPLEA